MLDDESMPPKGIGPHPNRVLKYLTVDDRIEGYRDYVVAMIASKTSRSITVNDEFCDFVGYCQRKQVHPDDCANEVIRQMGWQGESQTDEGGHVHEEDNDR